MGPSEPLKLDAESPDLVVLTASWEESQPRAFEALPHFSWENPAPGTAPS